MLHPAHTLIPTTLPDTTHVDPEIETFKVLLDADAKVDEIKLRRASSSGIPLDIRPYVWKLLLGVAAFEKADDVSLERNRFNEYNSLSHNIDTDGEIPTRIRKLLKKSREAYLPKSMYNKKTTRQGSTSGESYDDDLEDDIKLETTISTSLNVNNGRPINYARTSQRTNVRIITREITSKFTRVITSYLQRCPNNVEYADDMVYLCAPFIEIMSTEADAFYAFNALMQRYQHMFTEEGLHDAVSEFINMFRTLHPCLYDHFVSEEVHINTWARKWLRGLLVSQLPRQSLLRLWDSYFANRGGDELTLHPYVCLVFIEHLKPELQDCDDGEAIVGILNRLPPIDIDRIIAHANTAKQELRGRGFV